LAKLTTFHFDDVVFCPKESIEDFRLKKEYTEDEQRILNLLYKVDKNPSWSWPRGGSGFRGDGSKYAETCEFFGGYGDNRDFVWNYHTPQPYVWCSKIEGKRLYTIKVASDCLKRRFASVVARNLDLIRLFGSADLETTLMEECLKCKHLVENKCNFDFGCEKGNSYFTNCIFGDCDNCKEKK
jgi:hypothetical protein